MKGKGKFIVLDGIDGSGKATHLRLLRKHLESKGLPVAHFDFPQYSKPSSYFVKKYLNGRYGKLLQVGPYKASLFYALDRFDARNEIAQAINSGSVVLSNRYVAANMGHQGARITDPKVRKEFFYWIQHLEFDIFEIPRPDINILLNIPAKTAQLLIDKKLDRSYLKGKSRDIHESSLKHLKNAEKTYKDIAKFDPYHFSIINCTRGNKLLPVPEIQNKIREKVDRILS